MELTEAQKTLVKLMISRGIEKDVIIPTLILASHEEKFLYLTMKKLVESPFSEDELLQLMADYIQKEHPKEDNNHGNQD